MSVNVEPCWTMCRQMGLGESTSVHSRERKTRVAEVYRYFFSKRFINHSIIIKSWKTCSAQIEPAAAPGQYRTVHLSTSDNHPSHRTIMSLRPSVYNHCWMLGDAWPRFMRLLNVATVSSMHTLKPWVVAPCGRAFNGDDCSRRWKTDSSDQPRMTMVPWSRRLLNDVLASARHSGHASFVDACSAPMAPGWRRVSRARPENIRRVGANDVFNVSKKMEVHCLTNCVGFL